MTVPILVTRGKVLAAALAVGSVMAFTIIVVVVVALKVNDVQQREIASNRKAAIQAKQLARALQPTDAELARGASRALGACLAQPECLRALRGAIRRARLRRSDLPALRTPSRPSRPTTPGGGSFGGSTGTGGSGTTTAPRRPAPAPSPPRPTPRPRPRAPRPRPAPRPPSNPPATTPAPTPTSPPSGSTSQPPPVPVPPPPTLPVPVPPIPLPGVCTPVVNVNCPKGSIDPGSNSGRGNSGDQPCDRIKRPDLCPPDSSSRPRRR
jgi:hypothetical protein